MLALALEFKQVWFQLQSLWVVWTVMLDILSASRFPHLKHRHNPTHLIGCQVRIKWDNAFRTFKTKIKAETCKSYWCFYAPFTSYHLCVWVNLKCISNIFYLMFFFFFFWVTFINIYSFSPTSSNLVTIHLTCFFELDFFFFKISHICEIIQYIFLCLTYSI